MQMQKVSGGWEMNSKCIICKREFKFGGKSLGIPIRHKNGRTCSGKHAKALARIRGVNAYFYKLRLEKQKAEFRKMIIELYYYCENCLNDEPKKYALSDFKYIRNELKKLLKKLK